MRRLLLVLFVSAGAWAQSTTPFLGLSLPAPGTPNWNVPVNSNFTAIDTYLASLGGGSGGGVASGLLAARPTCNSSKVGLYFATDQPQGQQVYSCSNTSGSYVWTQVVLLGPSGALAFTNGALDIVTSVLPTLPAANTFTGSNTFSGTLSVAPLFAPPYLHSGSNFYLPSGYQATLPTAPASWSAGSAACSGTSNAPGIVANGANGNIVYQDSSTGLCWGVYTASASIESAFSCSPVGITLNGTGNTTCGIWLYDSTNSKVFELGLGTNQNSSGPPTPFIVLNAWTWTGSGSISTFSSAIFSLIAPFPTNDESSWRLRVGPPRH